MLPEAANPDNAGATGTPLHVGEWNVDPQSNMLARDGQEATRLEPKAVEVLMRLARRPGSSYPKISHRGRWCDWNGSRNLG